MTSEGYLMLAYVLGLGLLAAYGLNMWIESIVLASRERARHSETEDLR